MGKRPLKSSARKSTPAPRKSPRSGDSKGGSAAKKVTKVATKVAAKGGTKRTSKERAKKADSGAAKARATKTKTAATSATKPTPGAARPTTKPSGGKMTKEPAKVASIAPNAESTSVAKITKRLAGGKKGANALPAAHAERPISTDRKTDLKAQFAKLSSATNQISGLKRSINRNFYDVGQILNRIRDERLYEIKGYGSFESFVEREIEINKAVCLRSARIAEAINRDEALAAGLERASAAVAALDGELESSNLRPAGSPVGTVPLHKQ